jgi:hypothetical protein
MNYWCFQNFGLSALLISSLTAENRELILIIWKGSEIGSVMVKFKVISRCLTRETEENIAVIELESVTSLSNLRGENSLKPALS